MPFLGVQPAETALTTGNLADDIVTEAKMANDAIGLAELKAGTDGELITWDASGNPVAVGAGTSGHFLKSQGAGSVPVFAAAGGGKILQVVGGTRLTAQSALTSTSYADVGLAAASLTTAATSSKVLVYVIANWGIGGNMEVNQQIYRDIDSGGYSALAGSGSSQNRITTTNSGEILMFLDSPATAGVISYKLYYKVSTSTAYVNYTASIGAGPGGSGIVLLEVGA